ncbi:MAG: hypothetical protein ACM3ST_05290 [Bdellovibrio bacteriovorus]
MNKGMHYPIAFLLLITSITIQADPYAFAGCNTPLSNRNYSVAFKECLALALQGSPEAQNVVGNMYLEGQGTAKSYDDALMWLSRAAKAKEPYALNNLGVMYFNGLGVHRDLQRAHSYFMEAAELANYIAQYNLGVQYYDGQGVPKDLSEGIRWYTLSAEQGYAPAMAKMGEVYDKGEGVPQSHKEALLWYSKAAAQGHPGAQRGLGYLYMHGLGVPEDHTKAFELFLLAATAGNMVAQNDLGYMYDYGIGIERDSGLAMSWYKKSADQGYTIAQRNLELLGGDYSLGQSTTSGDDISPLWFLFWAVVVVAVVVTISYRMMSSRADNWRPSRDIAGTTDAGTQNPDPYQPTRGKLLLEATGACSETLTQVNSAKHVAAPLEALPTVTLRAESHGSTPTICENPNCRRLVPAETHICANCSTWQLRESASADNLSDKPRENSTDTRVDCFPERCTTPVKASRRPRHVSHAVTLLYITLAVGLVRSIIEASALASLAGVQFVLFVTLFTFAAMAVLILLISQGRNWARVLYLILSIIGTPLSVIPLLNSIIHHPFSGVLGITQLILTITALFLLFQPKSSAWFRSTIPGSR